MTEETLLSALFVCTALAFALLWIANILSVGMTREKFVTSAEGPVNAILRIVLLGSSLLGILVYCLRPDWMAWSVLRLPNGLRWMGFAVTVFGILLFAWVLRTLGKNFSTSLTIQKTQTLIVTGPYRWVRHPMYTAFILIWSGYLLHSMSWFIGISGLACFLWTIWIRTPLEEQMMISRFGEEYLAYMRKTGRYLPKLR